MTMPVKAVIKAAKSTRFLTETSILAICPNPTTLDVSKLMPAYLMSEYMGHSNSCGTAQKYSIIYFNTMLDVRQSHSNQIETVPISQAASFLIIIMLYRIIEDSEHCLTKGTSIHQNRYQCHLLINISNIGYNWRCPVLVARH